MNKYQEALNNLVKVSCPKQTFCKKCDFEKVCNCDAKQDINTLQELVDKATPKKPLVKHYEEIGEKPYIKTCCPNGCRIQLSKATDRDYAHEHRFCNKCGQAIDWSDEE
nr:MAG TPA: fibrinogen [Caudoviricetes sp.]